VDLKTTVQPRHKPPVDTSYKEEKSGQVFGCIETGERVGKERVKTEAMAELFRERGRGGVTAPP